MSDYNGSSGNGLIIAAGSLGGFVTLKLLGALDWSWFWVLAPIWFPAVIVTLVIVASGIISNSFTRG